MAAFQAVALDEPNLPDRNEFLAGTWNWGYVADMSKLEISRRGVMLVLSSPSGAGKTTIARALLKRDPMLSMSISHTTRQKRSGETDGRDYHFVDDAAFAAMVAGDGFLEHAEVFGNSYGTPKAEVETSLNAGRDLLFDIDWQGNRKLKQMADGDLVSIFVLPPSTDELSHRLHTRAQDSEDVVRKRMAKAQGEIRHWDEFDYVIVNDDVEKAIAEVLSILQAERLRRERRTGLLNFVRQRLGV